MSLLPLLLSAALAAPVQVPAGGSEEATRLIEEGRGLLRADRPRDAETLFARAAELEPWSTRTRMWVLRSWMEQGRVNDALDATDELARHEGAIGEVDYLYGMAWFLAAEKKLEQDARGPSLERNLSDALKHLTAATAADPERFGDAWYPLAKVAWMSRRPALAREAATAAAAREPGDPRPHHLLGRVAVELHEVARADPERGDEAAALEREALLAFERSAERLGRPTNARDRALLSETHLQLVFLHLLRRDTTAAGAALARAIPWDPQRIDYEELQFRLPPEVFVRALTEGVTAFERDFEGDGRIGPVHWWLGYAQFRAGRWSAAERSFLSAVATRREGLRTAWYYVARLRYVQRNLGGAVAALRAFWEDDPAALLGALEADAEVTGVMLERLGRYCADEGRLVDATIVMELAAEVTRGAESWRTLGNYLADEAVRRFESEGPGSVTAERCNRTALRAFERAHRTAPDSPLHMLDLATHLHLALDEELDRARELYSGARAEAGRRLLDPTVDLEERRRLTEIMRLAKENLERLDGTAGGE